MYLATCKAALPSMHLGPSIPCPTHRLETTMSNSRFLWCLGLDFRDPPAVTRLLFYCWLHILAQCDRLPGCSKHFWNKWTFNLDLLSRCLVASLAVKNGPGYLSYEATCKAALHSIDLRRSRGPDRHTLRTPHVRIMFWLLEA